MRRLDGKPAREVIGRDRPRVCAVCRHPIRATALGGRTGDKVDVPPKKVPYFKPGKELKELINQEPPQV